MGTFGFEVAKRGNVVKEEESARFFETDTMNRADKCRLQTATMSLVLSATTSSSVKRERRRRKIHFFIPFFSSSSFCLKGKWESRLPLASNNGAK